MRRDLQLKDYFLFTQHSLSTFESCPLKFKKRYLENLKWDSFPDENVKRRLEMGNDFHLLANRYFLGVDDGLDGLEDKDEDLQRWLESLKRSFSIMPHYRYYPEYKIRMADSALRLEANYDLILVKGDTIEIWDWKTHSGNTGSLNTGNKKRYGESLQTMVYMFVLKEQARLVMGREIDCESISMYYWQPEPPHIIDEIRYSGERHRRAGSLIKDKIERIAGYDYSGFDKTLYMKHCKCCEFNWFCNNEKIDFESIEEDEDFLESLEWECIEEKF